MARWRDSAGGADGSGGLAQVAEALCDVIDCVAAQHGQRIHMHPHGPDAANAHSRRTSFPSRPFSSPIKYVASPSQPLAAAPRLLVLLLHGRLQTPGAVPCVD